MSIQINNKMSSFLSEQNDEIKQEDMTIKSDNNVTKTNRNERVENKDNSISPTHEEIVNTSIVGSAFGLGLISNDANTVVETSLRDEACSSGESGKSIEKDEIEEDLLNGYLLNEIVECYNAFDECGNDFLSLHELASAFASFNIDVDVDDCRAIIDAFDTTGYGHIKFHDFHREMYDIMLHGTSEEHLKMVFDMMDTNKNGFIGPNEITTQFQSLGAIITEDEASEAIAKIDKQNLGVIDFAQFKAFCNEMDKLNEPERYT